MEAYLAQIMLFAGSYAPRSWVDCDGRTMQIAENQSLFALIGNTYGGDARTTFNLPKLDAPVKGARYVICVEGLWPPRD